VIECKWTQDKPWVIFSSRRNVMAPSAAIAQSMASQAGQAILWAFAGHDDLCALSCFAAEPRAGFNGRQAFSKGTDVLYNACQSLASNAFAYATHYDREDSPVERTLKHVYMVRPVLVLDGALFEAFLDPTSGNLQLERKSRVRLNWRGAEKWRFHTMIDVVTIDALEEFAVARVRECDTVLAHLCEGASQLRAAFETMTVDSLQVFGGARGSTGVPPLLQQLARRAALRNEISKPPGV
jgi:hypothetical protein